MGATLRLAAFFVVHVVVDAEAGAGGGVHLLGGVDRVLQLGDPVLHLGQLFLDLVLQVADLLLRNLKRRLVELALLIGDDWHLLSFDFVGAARDYSLKSTRTLVHDFTRTPSFSPAENVERRMDCWAASLRTAPGPLTTRVSRTWPVSEMRALTITDPCTCCTRAIGG